MTTSYDDSRDKYTGDNSTVDFVYNFRILDDDDIIVEVIDTSDNSVTTKTKTTHYSVSGVGDAGGGTVTFVTAPTSTEKVVLSRNQTMEQQTDYIDGGAFPESTVESDFDKLVMMVQQLNSKLTYKVPYLTTNDLSSLEITMPSSPGDKFLKFNSAGTGFEFGTPTTTAIAFDTGTSTSTIDAAGEAMIDTDGDGSTVTQGVMVIHDGTRKMYGFFCDSYPTADNQAISYDSATNKVIWQTLGGSGISNVLEDTTPQSGGDFDMNGNDLQFDDATGIQDDSGNYQIRFQKTASAVNFFDYTNAATGSNPSIKSVGSDTHVGFTLDTQGTSSVATYSINGTKIFDLSASGFQLASGARVTTVLDEDNMASDSATALATQQSIKAYVDSQSASGKIGQVTQTVKTDTYSTSTATATDITGMSASITPSSTSSKVRVRATLYCITSGSYAAHLRLLRGATEIGSGASAGSRTTAIASTIRTSDTASLQCVHIDYIDSPSTTSSTTYKLQTILQGGTFYLNRSENDSDSATYGRTSSNITLEEILP